MAKAKNPIADYKVGTHNLEYENYKDNVEKYYFWLVDFMKLYLNFEVEKLQDDFTASVSSSFWGHMEQRKGLQQDKAAQYLGTIGGMLKSIHQLIRELRMMDERWEHYKKSQKGDKGAEIALKSLWIQFVEGGGQNPNSVLGLATQVGFVTLPDLFFDVTPKSTKDVDKVVDGVAVNESVKNVLKRKLYQYLEWKEQTDKEIAVRRNFTLKYLRQHFNSIKLYLSWVRPYLKNVKRLQQGDVTDSTDILASSEGAVIELEIFGVKKFHEENIPDEIKYKYKKYMPVVQIKIKWRVRPHMVFQNEYQKGGLHSGRAFFEFNSYVMTQEQIDKYKKQKDEEDMELLTSINMSMDAIKDDLDKYLKEAGEIIDEEGEEEEKRGSTNRLGFLSPFSDLGKGFKLVMPRRTKKKGKKDTWSEKEEKAIAKSQASVYARTCYQIFKKAHGMVQW